MIIQRAKYLEMQAARQEDELEQLDTGGQIQENHKYQLTLEMIESESVVNRKAQAGKATTAGAEDRRAVAALAGTMPLKDHGSGDETLTAERESEMEPEVDRPSYKHDWR